MDLQEFLSLERQQLQKERQRLTTQKPCPATQLMTSKDFKVQCRRAKELKETTESNEPATQSSSLATDCQSEEFHLDLQMGEEEHEEVSPNPSKSTKEFANQRQLLVGSARQYKSPDASIRRNLENERPLSENRFPIRPSDDMEQWVTDTFYSYFPGFNNENQKRQNYLRERQRENQQNFLKHQMLHPPANKHLRPEQLRKASQQAAVPAQNRSSQSSTSTSNHSTTDKTDLELIVNSNPNYVPPKIRPGTTRQKLLQDLGHVELSNIVTGDGIMERNLRSAELETARKKDYQRDLMQQIDEKRRSIELIREKERRQEEALTRRLEAQLKTIQLEEQLEKERLRAERARIDSEQNRLMREQLLAKLEQDAQLLHAKETNNLAETPRTTRIKSKSNNANNISTDSNTNRVYKYFSNSAHHEYRRGQPLPPAVELDFEVPQMAKIERECFHLCEKICPLCDEPLRSYESCCLRCQRKLALKLKQKEPKRNGESEDKPSEDSEEGKEVEERDNNKEEDSNHNCQSSYALVCHKCERLYAMCSQCLAKSDVCRACQRERNVCMNCRRNLCSFCLEEVACGRDTERTHVNDKEIIRDPPSNNAFQVLELNYAVPPPKDTTASNPADVSPPYSVNIARNSVFHDDYKPSPVKPSILEQLPTTSGSANTSFDLDSADEQAVERVRRQTDQRLSRYLKNYGDLATKQHQKVKQLELQRSKSESRHRGTQTTPQSLARRDVVLREAAGHNLSMPLLREMPKMTRQETGTPLAENSQRKIDNLKKRWEVPAVQKFTVSTSSPKILTQVGAIRKQLQAARFFDDEVDPEDY
ncbi:trichohyalin [Drosophila eugracilis]|uniref:trichohyalin n=1 Tax=Drosophila eugracilis TaxID=29029 RepID=UPI001BD9DF2C|nr:trichohyalin [Drosophila eugracilis]